jgi:hypothetical protein
VCYLFQARDEERLPGLVDRWESYGIAAQAVWISPTWEHNHTTGRQPLTPERLHPG